MMARLAGIGWDREGDRDLEQRVHARKEQAAFDRKVLDALRNPKVIKRLLEIAQKGGQ